MFHLLFRFYFLYAHLFSLSALSVLLLILQSVSLKAFSSSVTHLSRGQSIKYTSHPLQLKAALPVEEFTSSEKYTNTHKHKAQVMFCCFSSRPPSLALAPREWEAKWWSFGAESSVGTFLMLSELPLGLTYAYSSQHPEAITPAGGPIKPMLSLQWNDLNWHSHTGNFPTGSTGTRRSTYEPCVQMLHKQKKTHVAL